ncbi:phosphate-starvation-inducible PsiE family protein [Beggiatoa alba]|nr:phosphate-starvation-inducible PsiE family protein [Beggiatoa alba]
MTTRIRKTGTTLVNLFHYIALFVTGATIVWSAVHFYIGMIASGSARLEDILLLFIYLELGAMIGIYFQTKKLPVNFLVYIAITALTRVLTVDTKTMDSERIIYICAGILLLGLASLAISYSKKLNDASITTDDKLG